MIDHVLQPEEERGKRSVAGVWIGLAIMVASETATLARVEPFYSWNTPICWSGFILFADSIVWRVRGDSWIRTSPHEFTALALVSIPLWVVFEGYNQIIDNWYYTGLPENVVVRYVGYAWSFATISPALFEGAELVAVMRGARGRAVRKPSGAMHGRTARAAGWTVLSLFFVVAGAAMLLSPFLVSRAAAHYLAAPVWLGFVLLLDPINDRLGGESIAGDAADRGSTERLTNLLLSGLLCGVLWEFWNYWSGSKWHYSVPFMEHVKIFEMPLPGYFGFPPFAVECFAMYVFVRTLGFRLSPGAASRGRAIGL